MSIFEVVKFIYRLTLNTLSLILVDTPLQVISMPVVAIVLLVIPSTSRDLPRIVRWFDSWECPIYGDDAYNTGNTDQQRYSFGNRFNWLCLRNPCNYFCYKIEGYAPSTEDKVIQLVGSDENVGHIIDTGGFTYREILTKDHKIKYVYAYAKPYTLFGTNRMFRFYLGWKINGQGKVSKFDTPARYQGVFQFNPFKEV